MTLEDTIKSKRFIGRPELIKHLKGGRLTYRKACRAKCFECMNGYADGAVDCQIPACPLYRTMPYVATSRATAAEVPKTGTCTDFQG